MGKHKENQDRAYDLVAGGAVGMAIEVLAGKNEAKIELVQEALFLASMFDKDDWAEVQVYLGHP